MSKEMLINVSEGEECRIALLEDGRLEELYMERSSSTSHVGNIYKGKVTNVEPAIQAAFVDFGLGRNGFLHISDLLPSYFGKKGEDIQESVGRKMARRDRPPIQRCLRRGDEITVQIIKEGIGTKGPTLSTYLSIPGRILVMMPGMENFGVSRKIEDDQERRRLRKILDELDPLEGVGFIVRTAGMGKSKAEIEKDLKYLTRLWENIEKIRKTTKAPVELYTEGDLVTRTVRDVYGSDVEKIVIDSKDVAKRVKDFVKLTAPRGKTKVELYKEPIPLFHKYGIEKEIEQIHSRTVPLPSGGSLIIDSTEAVVAIDVNSGKFREHADAETTAFKTDMEAADEIPRQLKLRDLGGVIICDFIDLRFERHRRQLEQRLYENFKRDKAKTRVLRMSEFGIIEITRQRMRPSLKRSIYADCPHCKGHGLVKTPESMALDVMRKLALAVHDERVTRVELGVCAEVAFFLHNSRRRAMADLESETGKTIEVHAEEGLALDEAKFELFDARDGRVYLDVLGMTPDKDERGRQGRGRGGRGDRRQHNKPESVKAFQEMDEEDDAEEGGESAPESRDGDRGGRRDDHRRDRDRGQGGGGGGGGSGQHRGQQQGRHQQGGGHPQQQRGGQQQGQGNRPHQARPFDKIRPVGIDPIKAGDGHRGPQVIAPAEGEGEVDQEQLVAEGNGVGGPPHQGEGTPGEGGGGRRRRRRRRGGRGRRRNRQFDEFGNPIPGNQGQGAPEGQSDAEDTNAGTEEDAFDDADASASVQDDGDTASNGDDIGGVAEVIAGEESAGLGEAPSALGEDDAVAESPVYPAPTEVTDEPVEIGDAPSAVTDEGSDEIEVVERTPRSAAREIVEEPAAPVEEEKPARGRGGRGKRAKSSKKSTKKAAAPVEEATEAAEPQTEGLSSAEETQAAEAPSTRSRGRRGRGGRGRGGRGKAASAEAGTEGSGDEEGEADVAAARAAASSQRVPPKAEAAPNSGAKATAAPAPAPEAPKPATPPAPKPTPTPLVVPPMIRVVRTGWSDKHLANDQPVDPDMPGRPQSYSDLDALPDED